MAPLRLLLPFFLGLASGIIQRGKKANNPDVPLKELLPTMPGPALLRERDEGSTEVALIAERCNLLGDAGSTKTEISVSCIDNGKRILLGTCTRVHKSAFTEMLESSDFDARIESVLTACEEDLCQGHLNKKFSSLSYVGSSFSACREFIQHVPTSIIATAGMRLWANQHSEEDVARIEARVKASLKESRFQKNENTTQFIIINGMVEAFLGFMTVAEQQSGLPVSQKEADMRKLAYLEIGGASAQIAFACPQGGEGVSPSSLLEMHGLMKPGAGASQSLAYPLSQASWEIFGKSFLGGGVNRVMSRVITHAVSSSESAAPNNITVASSPCLAANVAVVMSEGTQSDGKCIRIDGIHDLQENPLCEHVDYDAAIKTNVAEVRGTEGLTDMERVQACTEEVALIFRTEKDELRNPVAFSKDFSETKESLRRCSLGDFAKSGFVVSASPIAHAITNPARFNSEKEFGSTVGSVMGADVSETSQVAELVSGAIAIANLKQVLSAEQHATTSIILGTGADWTGSAIRLHDVLGGDDGVLRIGSMN